MTAWLRGYRASPSPRLRLVCFPHAGGTANMYRTWPRHLPEDVDVLAVQYPGRQDRIGEPAIHDMSVLAEAITEAVTGLADRPLVLFGHSMGASVAYEVVWRLPAAVRSLVVSGHDAPHRSPAKPILHADGELIAEVRASGGAGEALEDPELRELVLPALRADYRLIRGYLPTPPRRVPVPITAYTGRDDGSCAPDAVRAWSELTDAEFTLMSFPGGHFFLESAEPAVLADLTERMR